MEGGFGFSVFNVLAWCKIISNTQFQVLAYDCIFLYFIDSLMAIRAVWDTDGGFWELGLDFFFPIWFLFIRNAQFLVVLKDIVYKIGIFVLKFCFLWVLILYFLRLFCLFVWVNGEVLDTLWLTLLFWIKIISNTQFQFVANDHTFSFFIKPLFVTRALWDTDWGFLGTGFEFFCLKKNWGDGCWEAIERSRLLARLMDWKGHELMEMIVLKLSD